MVSGYSIVCFVVLQIADVTFGPLGISDTVLRVIIAVMLLALPVVAYLAWVFDVGQDGEVVRSAGKHRWIEAGVTLAAVCGLAFGAWWALHPRDPVQEQTTGREPTSRIELIAVLPLVNLSGDPGQDYFSDGTTEMLIEDIGKVSSLTVSSRQSVVQYKESKKTAREIALELGVDGLLTGSIVQTTNRLRVNVQLYSAHSDSNIWSERYERDLTDILTLQSDIARTVVQQLNVEMTGGELAALSTSREVDPESHKAYLLGRYHISRGAYTLAVKEFERAIELDASNADALAEMARITNIFVWSGASPQELMPMVREYIRRALAVEPTHSHAMATEALLVAFEDQEYQQSIDRFAELLTTHPNDYYILLYYGYVLEVTDHLELSRLLSSRIVELDPLDAAQTKNLGETYFQMGEYSKALAFYQQAENLGRPVPLSLAQLAAAQGDKEALDFQLQRDIKDWSDGTAVFRVLFQAFFAKMEGDQQLLQDTLGPYDNEDNVTSWFYLSYFPRALGDTRRAVQYYSRALENKEPQALMKAVGAGGEIEMYPEFYKHPDYLEMLRINGLDAASIAKLKVPPLPF